MDATIQAGSPILFEKVRPGRSYLISLYAVCRCELRAGMPMN